MQSLGDIFGQVFRAIWANKLRSFLTMFGIAWGVGSMLLLIGVGEGFQEGQKQQLSRFGTDVVMVWNGTAPAVASQQLAMRPYYLTLRDEQAIATQAPDVRAITAMLSSSNMQQQSLYQTVSGSVNGVQVNYPDVRLLPIAEGRFLNVSDEANRNLVAVLGQESAAKLFPGHPALGSYITLGGYRFLVVGIAAKIGHGNNTWMNQQIYIPLTVMLNRFPITGDNVPSDAVSTLQYKPRTPAEHLDAVAEVHAIIARRHGFDPNATEAFNEWDTIQTVNMVNKIFESMNMFLGSVGLVTLALGGLGIVNIMLVSVTERTREIGVRKALGATRKSILMQFFIEGLTLTALSGLVGIGGASGFMWILQQLIGNGMQGFAAPHVVPWTAALAFGSLALCGILAGLYPASRAASLEPVEALRKE